jgi:hypothetical protein
MLGNYWPAPIAPRSNLMSEEHPVYIRCASGSNSHTDCVVRPHGDCVEILGHPLMTFAPDDAVRFATAILHATGKTGDGGTDETVSKLRSRMAMALHCPELSDDVTRPLLTECSEALAYLEREADYWRREWREAVELTAAEVDDGK